MVKVQCTVLIQSFTYEGGVYKKDDTFTCDADRATKFEPISIKITQLPVKSAKKTVESPQLPEGNPVISAVVVQVDDFLPQPAPSSVVE
ncbi:MAG: hypothetical protein FWD52_00380 [Candidatus Bathyarchaeota archaeon]|nr:hypothetical protein [Candidatus Termiticorpusculum sp.]